MSASRNNLRRASAALALLATLGLSACGGGDDPAAAPPPPPAPPPSGGGGGTTVDAAPLVITEASPATLDGTLETDTAQFESNSSNKGMTTFASTDPYCRVAAYTLVNSGDGNRYYLEVSFRKDNRAIGLVKFGDDASFALIASARGPTTGAVVDIVNRRVGFTGLVLQAGTTTLTLDGALDYPTNIAPENQAACG